ncbi:MAG TPA: hypothetical protein VGQ19_04820, partial [Burkholderiales bacterium]|nr:hypothetical protein [Burkholderiales bacterium]
PPRLRRFGGFATSFYWRSHPSSRGGEYARSLLNSSSESFGCGFAALRRRLHHRDGFSRPRFEG